MVEFFKTKDLKIVDVRSYIGVEYCGEAWMFLGYDVVKESEDGKSVSIFDENKQYEYLKKYPDNERYYDHTNVNIDDVRIVELGGDFRKSIFGKARYISKSRIEKWIDENPSFNFMNYKKEQVKVKKIGKK